MRGTLLLLILIIPGLAISQQYVDSYDPREIKSLLGKENHLNGFGGMDVKISDFFDERSLILGGYGGVLVNRNYFFGIAGYGIATQPNFDGITIDDSPSKLTLNGGYAGLLIGGTILAREIVHLSIPVILGVGEVQISDEDFFPNVDNAEFTIERSTFFVGEPGAELEFNITPTFRIAAGASYRYIYGLELRNLVDEDLTNWTGTVSFRFGRF
jgi:hypothetical protein